MRAGKLARRRITIQKLAGALDDLGTEVQTWTDVVSRWASIEPLTGRETFARQQQQAELSHLIRLHYVPDITAKMRVVCGTRTFDIQAVLNLWEGDRYLELLVTERV